MPKAEAKKIPDQRASKKVVEEVVEGDENSPSSSEFDNIFYVNYD